MRRSLFWIVIFALMGITLASESKAQEDVDFRDPDSLFRYVNNAEYFGQPAFRMLRGDSCNQALDFLREHVFPRPDDGTIVPITCSTLNEAWELYSGSEYYWAACMPERGEAGQSAHISACLDGYDSRNNRALALDSCAAVFDTYDEALKHAVDPAAFVGFVSTPVPRDGGLRRSMDGVTLEVWRTSMNIDFAVRYGPRDCAIAADVIQARDGSVDWLACTDFDPDNVVPHIEACLGPDLDRRGDCPSVRSLYEERLAAAYGGSLPSNYATLTCPQIAPIFERRVQATEVPVSEPEVIQQTERPAEPIRNTGGSGSTFFWFLLIFGGLGAVGYLLYQRQQGESVENDPIPENTARSVLPTGDEAKRIIASINAKFDAATGRENAELECTVRDQMEFTYEQRTSFKEVEFDVQAMLARSVGAMPKADREMLRVVSFLEALGDDGISKALKHARLGLVYGDGKAEILGHSYGKVFKRYVIAKNLASSEAVVRLGMQHLGMNVDVAKGIVVDVVERLQGTSLKTNPLVQEATARLRGGAAWAGQGDLDGPFDPDAEDGLFFGLEDETGLPVRFSGEGSLITIAAPGSGKTQANVIPNLLEWSGPAIVLDVKGELFADTAAWRAKNVGPVYRFAPMEPDESHCFNPLDLVRSDPEHLWEDARFLASMIIVPSSKSNDPYWDNRSQDFLTAAIAAVCIDREGSPDRSLARVIDFVHAHDLPEMLARLQTSGVRALERAGSSWEQTMVENAKQFDSFLSGAQTAMSAWESSKVERVISRSDWHPFDLRQAPYPTIYICLKPGEIDVYSSLLRVFVAQHIRTLVSELPEGDVKPILFMLDELPRLKYMPPIEEALEVGRQYGIKLWMFAQSLGQLENAYPNAKGMIGSCAVRSFMNASMHDGTAERISKELGTFESPLDGSKQNIAEPQELAGERYQGLQLVLPAGRKPIRVTKQFAYETEPYSSRMDETLG